MPIHVDDRLRAQLDYLRSDDRLRELAAVAAAMTPEERLAQAWEMSRSAAGFLDALPSEERERVEAARGGVGHGAERVLRRLAGLATPGTSDAGPRD